MSFIKTLFIMITSLITGLFADKSEIAVRPENAPVAKQTLYDFKVKSLVGGKTVDLSKYKGKKVVILNVASKCGYTKQYADWEKFYKDHGDKVVVLGFPANNFGGQEPGTSEEIATFCSATYGVTFPMFEKVSVTGDDQAPIYKWLSDKDANGWNDKVPTWNFCKYVINEKGELTHFFASKVLPTDAEFTKAVGI
ncbi:glutathione peroxidase [Dyadobacter fermentans DSM 18053]|uniref:Glutathione peroxidase n=2 Tax=Dyadobacter fermentans TaxID=94254 RepID=C6W2P2_DYAFD|nr:glutathione peroxidase [Dyadobacter fermentans DSM 18053]